MLNLLPFEKKQALQLEFLWRRISSFSRMLFFSLVVLAALLVSTWLYTVIQYRAEEQSVHQVQSSPQGQRIKDLEGSIKRTNLTLKYLEELKLNQSQSSYIIEALVNLTPASIRFESISLDFTHAKGTIIGFAEKRTDLLDLKEKLEQSDLFQGVELPLSHLLKEQNLDFTLSFALK